MTESGKDLSTLGEDEERSNFDIHSGIIYHDDQQEELETLDELEDIAPSVRTDANKFRMLCGNVQNSYSEIDNSMFELLELKDNLLLQFLPANVSTRIALVISRLYRAYSLSQIPINELVRLAHLYSQSFDMKSVALKKLYDNNETKKRMLNIALQRLTSMENTMKRNQQLRMINNWEKMYIHLALPRSNVRKWKFRLKTFRETAQLGYEHVIEWLNSNAPRPTNGSEVLSKDGPMGDDDDELDDADRIETSGDIGSVAEMDDENQLDQGSDFGDEIGSDNEGSFLSSAGKQKPKRIPETTTKREVKQTQPIIMTKVDMEIQAKPDSDDQQTSTGDILSTKLLIIRVYRPIGLYRAKFQCFIHAHREKYTTNVFSFDKSSPSKEDDGKSKGRLAANRTTRPVDSKTKKRATDSTTPDEIDLNTIDKQQYHEVVIPMPSVLKRRSLFETEIDPDAIQIELFGDDKLCGSLVLSPEDLRLLDLPNLSSPTSAPLIIIDDSISTVPKPVVKNDQLDFDQQSSEVYKSWISRTPQTFAVYNEKREPIAKLPLHMFWYNKVEITHATKCTMTAPLEFRTSTSPFVPVPQIPSLIETRERASSSTAMLPKTVVDESIQPSTSRLAVADDQVEAIKVTYEDKIAKIHENYQAEIRRLTKLLSEIPSHRSSQMAELSELDENLRDSSGDETFDAEARRQVKQPPQQQSKREAAAEHQPAPTYGKNLPKKFLDRYQMFLERSVAHRNQLVTKVEQDTARMTERQMEIQHRLHKPEQHEERYDDLCLPAVFMPFRSGNVFNPRAYRFFHHIGATDPRLTQTPSIFKLPPLPSGSVSVLNLFELSRCYEAANEKDRATDKTVSQSSQPAQPPAPPTTQTSN